MKMLVTYYDIETDLSVTKDCFCISNNDINTFEFTPVDNPVKIYKSVVLSHPIINVFCIDGRKIKIVVSAWQYTKDGYALTKTVIFNDPNE
jgi:hypothetical protein